MDVRPCNLPALEIFQSSISIVEGFASSTKISSVKWLIMALLKTRCLVMVAVLPWCTRPKIGWNKFVLPLLAAPIRQWILSVCRFWLWFKSLKKSSQNSSISAFVRLFSKVSEILWFKSLVGSNGENASDVTWPMSLSAITFSRKWCSLIDQHLPSFTSIKL